jgi:hypothetical protein
MPAAERSLSLSISLTHTHTLIANITFFGCLSPFHFYFKDALYILDILCGLTALLDLSYGIGYQI